MTRPKGEQHGARLVGGATAGVGAALIARPGLVACAVSDDSRVPSPVVRLLGARYLLQGAALLAWPRAAVLRGSAVADGVHAASMLAVAWRRLDYRRPALLSATVALASVALCASSGPLSNPRHR